MKILSIITKSNWGGAQTYVYDLATETARRGHDTLVAFGGDGTLAQKLRDAGIRTISLPSLERDVSPWKDFRSFRDILRLLRDENPDVLHLNSSKIGGLGALAGRIHNMRAFVHRRYKPTKIIFTGHGWSFTENWRPDHERILIALLHWLTIQLTHTTIAVSKKTREEVARIPFTWHKMTVIHNGVSEHTLLPRKDARNRLLGGTTLPENTLVIGTIGELHKNKGHTYALDGIAGLARLTNRPIVFVIIGSGEEEYALRKQTELLGLSNKVYFVTDITNGAVDYLAAFDIFLFSSIKEGLPYAILEAGKAGLPVIASAVGGIPEIIDDMESGILIQSKNPGEITRALRYLIDNDEKRSAMGEAIAARIRDKFNVSDMAGKTISLYTDTER